MLLSKLLSLQSTQFSAASGSLQLTQGLCPLICKDPKSGVVQGLESQNRSVDGDEVALRILAPCAWWVFKRDQLAAATKAAATEQESTGRAGIDLASLAASPSISDAGVGEPGLSQSFSTLRLLTCCSFGMCGLML